MMWERVIQASLVAAAIGIGFLGSRPVRDHAPGASHSSIAAAPPGSEPSSPGRPREPTARPWRSAAPVPAMHELVLVVPDELPTEELPVDEPRDPAWAAPREAAMTGMIDDRLAAIFTGVTSTVRCRRTTCRVELTAPVALEDKLTAYVAMAIPLGPSRETSWDRGTPSLLKMTIAVDLAKTPSLDAWRNWVQQVDADQRPEVDRLIRAEQEGLRWFPDE